MKYVLKKEDERSTKYLESDSSKKAFGQLEIGDTGTAYNEDGSEYGSFGCVGTETIHPKVELQKQDKIIYTNDGWFRGPIGIFAEIEGFAFTHKIDFKVVKRERFEKKNLFSSRMWEIIHYEAKSENYELMNKFEKFFQYFKIKHEI